MHPTHKAGISCLPYGIIAPFHASQSHDYLIA